MHVLLERAYSALIQYLIQRGRKLIAFEVQEFLAALIALWVMLSRS